MVLDSDVIFQMILKMFPFVSQSFPPKHVIELNFNGFVWVPVHKFALYHA